MTTRLHHTRPNRSHPGSSVHDIENEPNWTSSYKSHIGFRSKDGRRFGFTHVDDDPASSEDLGFVTLADEKAQNLKREIEAKELIGVRGFMEQQEVSQNNVRLL